MSGINYYGQPQGASGAMSVYTPTTRDVAGFIKNRTVDPSNTYLGDFNSQTAVTGDEVLDLIAKAEGFVLRSLDKDPDEAIPADATEAVKGLVALLAAILVELTKFSEQINTGRSPYPQLKELYDQQLAMLQTDLGIQPQERTGRLSVWELVAHQFGRAQYDMPNEPMVNWRTPF